MYAMLVAGLYEVAEVGDRDGYTQGSIKEALDELRVRFEFVP